MWVQSEELRKPVGAGAGVKPNKPKATDYQQLLTTQEAHGESSPTNTMGKLSDSQRKKV